LTAQPVGELEARRQSNKSRTGCYLFATQRLLLYGLAQRVVNECGGVSLHVRQHVAVEVERDANLAVAQALAGDLGMNARGQQVRRVRVP
jgi:hypothetical protein